MRFTKNGNFKIYDYNGEYLRPYEWSIETEQYLDNLKR